MGGLQPRSWLQPTISHLHGQPFFPSDNMRMCKFGSTACQDFLCLKIDKSTLLGTNISLSKAVLKMSFLFPRWDMIIPWRVSFWYLSWEPFLIWAVTIDPCFFQILEANKSAMGHELCLGMQRPTWMVWNTTYQVTMFAWRHFGGLSRRGQKGSFGIQGVALGVQVFWQHKEVDRKTPWTILQAASWI